MSKNKYDVAIYWFKTALNTKPNIKSGAFIQKDYYTFIPCINLCVCYDKIGKRKQAIKYNQITTADSWGKQLEEEFKKHGLKITKGNKTGSFIRITPKPTEK